MRLDIIDTDGIAIGLPEILVPKIFENRRFSKLGLFSQQIFGPVKSHHCLCSKQSYKGPRYGKKKCPICNVPIITSDARKKRFAKIALPFPVMNPLFFYLIVGNRITLKKILTEMLSYKAKYYFDTEGSIVRISEGDPTPEGQHTMSGLSGVVEYIRKILDMDVIPVEGDEDPGPLRKELQYVKDHFDLLTIKNVIIIPPDFRPCGKGNTDHYVVDDVNELYNKILKISNQLKDVPYPLQETEDVYKANFKYLQKLIFDLCDYILERMSKKTGLIRSNILGKRVDFSGRAVISPDPTLKLNECRLPYWMVLEILKPQLIAHFVNRRICKRYNQAIQMIDASIQDNDSKFFDVVQEFCKDKICVLNRQPTLHRLSVLAFKVKIHLGNTIQIHPMVCSPYNADFDGDAMAVYFPVTEEAQKDVAKHLGIWNNLVSPTDIKCVPKPNQDIILGIYSATKEAESVPMKELNGQPIAEGRFRFNECLPEDYVIIDEEVTKKKLITVLNDIALRYPPAVVMDTMDKIKELGFELSTIEGYTLSLSDLYNPRLLEYAQALSGDRQQDQHFIKTNQEFKRTLKACPFSIFIESGARGTWDQALQMVFTRGYVADADNKVRPNLIRSCLVKGLSPREFFDSCWGSRKGLLDTALSTGDSGYLTRQLIYSTATLELDETPEGEDCGTTDGMVVNITDKSMVEALLGRYYITKEGRKKLIKLSDAQSLIGRTITLRSPMYCKSKKICRTCYGKLYKVLHSSQIGIVATQAVGERATQLVLRTFHISGAAQSNAQGENEDIISGMSVAKKLFHNPKDIKELEDIKEPADLVKMIYRVFGQYGEIHLVHFEIIVAAMMWVGDKMWRLCDHRLSIEPEYVSILQVPSRSSWLLGCAFANLKQKLISGLIGGDGDQESSITSLFRL